MFVVLHEDKKGIFTYAFAAKTLLVFISNTHKMSNPNHDDVTEQHTLVVASTVKQVL